MSKQGEARKVQAREALQALGGSLENEYTHELIRRQHEALLVFLGYRPNFNAIQGAFNLRPEDRLEMHRPISEWHGAYVTLFPELIGESLNTLKGVSAGWITDYGIRTCNTAEVVEWNLNHWAILDEYETILRRVLVAAAREGQHSSGPLEAVSLSSTISSTPAGEPVEIESRNVFTQNGQFWTITFEGRTVQLKDLKGMKDVALLLARPHEEIPATEFGDQRTAAIPQSRTADASGEPLVARTDFDDQAMADEQTRRQVQEKLEEIHARRNHAESLNDQASVDVCNREVEELDRYLHAVQGLGRRARSFPTREERARKRVLFRIDQVRHKLEEHHPALAHHLEKYLKTGAVCSYRPDSAVHWKT